ncbi:histone-lysine N-methyltransferase SETD2-like isoform X2 [Dendronephthya gigantea]|uniref:histone-lysine N-methyltransferase SETD2-like isoform X2 n=1 Tax=Dendronephthya gigantea TaxID=151771 RepID=UPI00106A2355|nr:histone-lysine N-methyltransferase SETD2-like isoform X2 [Dendronephthya gigantea]
MDSGRLTGMNADEYLDTTMNRESEPDSDHSDHENEVASSTSEEYPAFETIYENIYLGNKKKRINKEIRRMSCDCSYSPEESDFVGCGDDCLNRLLMIECNYRCPCGEFCSNRKFQKGQKVKVEAFMTEKKGWGLRTLEDIAAHQFVIEYSGEVMGYEEFEKRVEMYDHENRRHYYFMTLKADEIIDATYKGNLSRFINHSCDPNCETQKWTVNGYLRIGFFSVRDIEAGTELTFDYKFQRYGKKAQVCYCESQNCRGIIGGEKHTPLKSIISGRPASPAPTSSPRRNRRRQLAEQFDDKPLEVEIAQLLAGDKGIKTDDQALKLSQFMVRADTTSQRLLLLNALLATIDQNCLRNFVRYQGLSLLWSWMVDLGENSLHLQKKIVQVLKHLPVANLNQVKDTKVLRVISKWAKKPSLSCVPEEETSSSDVDSRGQSPQDALDIASRRESHISSSSDELQNSSKSTEGSKSDIECKPSDVGLTSTECLPAEDSVFEPVQQTRSDDGLELPAVKQEGQTAEERNLEELNPEGKKPEEGLKSEGLKPDGVKHQSAYSRIVERIGDSSEEECSRWSEDDATSSDGENIVDLAADLLDQWSSLKEVYRIPKKSTIVVKQEPESTSGTTEAPSAELSRRIRSEKHAPVLPKIDEDLFKKDEFLSKLGEREFHSASKSSQREASSDSSEIPSLMTCGYTEVHEGANDAGRMSIHQRLQNVANTSGGEEKSGGWHAKAAARLGSRKGGYPPPRSPQQDWQPRHHFTPPTTAPTANTGMPRPNQNNQWHNQEQTPSYNPYLNTTQGVVQPSTTFSVSTQNTTLPVQQQPNYFQPPDQASWTSKPTFAPDQTGGHVQHTYGQLPPPPPQHAQASQGKFPAGHQVSTNPSQMASNHRQGQYTPAYQNPTTPFGYQQSTNQNQAYPQPLFNPMLPNLGVPPPHQFPPGFPPPQFPPNPSTFSLATQTTSVPSTYSVNPSQQPQFAPTEQNPGSNVPRVSSTVGSAVSMEIVDLTSEWAGKYKKTQEGTLPSDWKKAYDGEGRAYYYHVITRQTQWEPPVSDRSPPTPELGYLGDELDTSMESSLFSSHLPQDVTMEVVDSTKQRKKPRTPSTPPGSPPKSPVSKYTTAAADTTDIRKGAYSPSSLLQGRHLTPEQRKRRETFRMKLSAVVVNYLNPYHKLDCKIGRITSVDDFKFLARKLTHGVMVKELSRNKDESTLACNDSVKIKTKEYIRNYMQKFGPVYKPS